VNGFKLGGETESLKYPSGRRRNRDHFKRCRHETPESLEANDRLSARLINHDVVMQVLAMVS